MIWDGYWEKELERASAALRLWRVIASILPSEWVEHQINKALLYSALVIRKMIEAEKDAKAELKNTSLPMPALPLLGKKVPTWKYPYIGDIDFVVHRVWASDYNGTEAESYPMELEYVCNQIIHSYVWSVVYTPEKGTALGVMVSSDKYKTACAYLLLLDDWIETIRFCVKKNFLGVGAKAPTPSPEDAGWDKCLELI